MSCCLGVTWHQPKALSELPQTIGETTGQYWRSFWSTPTSWPIHSGRTMAPSVTTLNQHLRLFLYRRVWDHQMMTSLMRHQLPKGSNNHAIKFLGITLLCKWQNMKGTGCNGTPKVRLFNLVHIIKLYFVISKTGLFKKWANNIEYEF